MEHLYRLDGIGGDRIHSIVEMDETRFLHCKGLCKEFISIRAKQIRLMIAQSNCAELESALQRLTNSRIEQFDAKQQTATVINLNRLCLNFLGSFRACIDLSEKEIKTKYGANSAQFQEFKKILANEYDNHFEYRFLYHLRNFTHRHLPLNHISENGAIGENNNPVYTSEVGFDPQLLLEADKWKPELTKDLESLGEYLPAAGLFSRGCDSLERIHERVVNIDHPCLDANAKELLEIVKPALDKGLTPMFSHYILSVDGNATGQVTDFPYLVLQGLGYL
jgi:hypothetical protein